MLELCVVDKDNKPKYGRLSPAVLKHASENRLNCCLSQSENGVVVRQAAISFEITTKLEVLATVQFSSDVGDIATQAFKKATLQMLKPYVDHAAVFVY